jgi:hypothetical protein
MAGVTVKDVALVVAQAKLTNSPGATTVGVTEKPVTVGAVDPPPPPEPPEPPLPPLLPPEPEPLPTELEPPPHPKAARRRNKVSSEMAQRNGDLIRTTDLWIGPTLPGEDFPKLDAWDLMTGP